MQFPHSRARSICRLTLRASAVTVATLALLFMLLTVGSARAQAAATDAYTGWGAVTPAATTSAVTAWRWSGAAWQQASRPRGARTYVQPFGAGWLWTWTARDGWLAMKTSNVITAADADRVIADASRTPRVFAHFHTSAQMGVSGSNTVESYRAEVRKAKAMGVSGFAYNTVNVTKELPYIAMLYEAANAEGGFWLFPSADLCCTMTDADLDRLMYDHYADPARLRVDGGRFGAGLPVAQTWHGETKGVAWWNARQSAWRAAGKPMYFIPYFAPGAQSTDASVATWTGAAGGTTLDDAVDGMFNFSAFAKGDDQLAPVTRNRQYDAAIDARPGVDAMYGCAPHFNRHSDPNSAAKVENRIIGDFEGFTTWNACLRSLVDDRPRFVELVTWNDYLEGSYLGGPYASTQLWANYRGNHLSHDAFRRVGAYWLRWFQTGIEPYVSTDMVAIAHRPHLRCAPGVNAGADGSSTCAAAENDTDSAESRTGNTTVVRPLPRPFDWSPVDDLVYVTVLAKAAGRVDVISGGVTTSITVPAGLSEVSAPLVAGAAPTVRLVRGGATVVTATSATAVAARPTLFNYNVATAWAEA